MDRFFACLLFFCGSFSGLAQDWAETISGDSTFRLLAPGVMDLKIDTFETPVGPIAWHTYFLQLATTEETESSNEIFMLSYCDYPSFTLHSDSTELLEEFFKSTVEQAVKAVDGELRYVTDQTLATYPGKLWRIDYLDGQAVIKTRAFVVRNRFYSVQVITHREKHFNRDANRFLDSFQLLN